MKCLWMWCLSPESIRGGGIHAVFCEVIYIILLYSFYSIGYATSVHFPHVGLKNTNLILFYTIYFHCLYFTHYAVYIYTFIYFIVSLSFYLQCIKYFISKSHQLTVAVSETAIRWSPFPSAAVHTADPPSGLSEVTFSSLNRLFWTGRLVVQK